MVESMANWSGFSEFQKSLKKELDIKFELFSLV
jgi:hypothetical protein